MLTTSIILLNWNGKELLEHFMPSVMKCCAADNVRIVVADNASTDDSVSFLKENYPSVKILAFDRNYGFAEGYNKAIEIIDSDFVVLLNTDVEVTEGWLSAPLDLLLRNPEIAAVQPKIRSFRARGFFEYAGAAGGFMDKWGYPFCRGRLFSTIEKDKGQYDNECELFWASGACMFLRRSCFLEAGGFDASFFAHQEEIDLCWRLKNKGYKIFYTPDSIVYHMGGATLDSSNPRKTFLNFRNNRLMLYKNLAKNDRRRVFFVRYWLDAAAAMAFLFSGKVADAWAVFRAYVVFNKDKKTYNDNGITKYPLKKFLQVYQKSIVFSYYLKRKKRFTDLFSDTMAGR
ncbi:MAG: glycosyltransferase family 2 protein [Bacteroidales bacterium]|nr:glycosyltransferase family 2 protein [Bacteroidales bacterium]